MLKTIEECDIPAISKEEFRVDALNVFSLQEKTGKKIFLYDNREIPLGLGMFSHLDLPRQYLERCTDPRLVKSIIEERYDKVVNNRLELVTCEDRIHYLAPKRREIFQPRDFYSKTAEICETLALFDGDFKIEFDYDSLEINLSRLCQADFQKQVTPKVNDILRAGFKARMTPGQICSVMAYIMRLICLNGATSNEIPYSWKDSGTYESQLTFLMNHIPKAISSIFGTVKKAQAMAKEKIDGDPLDIIKTYSKSMGLPAEIVPFILSAYKEEEGDTLYDIFNAFTRAATHDERLVSYSRDIQHSSGSFLEEFDMVKCRIPRKVALSLGFSTMN